METDDMYIVLLHYEDGFTIKDAEKLENSTITVRKKRYLEKKGGRFFTLPEFVEEFNYHEIDRLIEDYFIAYVSIM